MGRSHGCQGCGHEYTDHLVAVLCEQLAFCAHTELLDELEELLAGEDPGDRMEAVGNLYTALSQQMLRKGYNMEKSPEAREAFKHDLARLRQFVHQQGDDSMTPTTGRIVLYHFDEQEVAPNGGDPCPAIITQVHANGYVNLRIFTDSNGAAADVAGEWRTSVASAESARPTGQPYWSWPPREAEEDPPAKRERPARRSTRERDPDVPSAA